MLLPMSLYMGASLSYDAALLACYYLMLALLTCPEWDGRTAAVYTAACVFANGTKPYINLLWVVLPLVVVRKNEWKARLNRAWYTVGTLAGALLLTQIVEQYGTLLRHNYGTIARQGGSTVNGGAQLLFVLKIRCVISRFCWVHSMRMMVSWASWGFSAGRICPSRSST